MHGGVGKWLPARPVQANAVLLVGHYIRIAEVLFRDLCAATQTPRESRATWRLVLRLAYNPVAV